MAADNRDYQTGTGYNPRTGSGAIFTHGVDTAQNSKIPFGLPNRDYKPISWNPKVNSLDATKYADDPFYNPYAGGQHGLVARDNIQIYGGKSDLLPTIATRSKATGMLSDLLARDSGAFANQLNQTAAASTHGDPLLQEAYQNYAPSFGAEMTDRNETLHRGLRDLLTQNYIQGGQIWGSEAANTGAVTQMVNARNKAKADKILGPFAGIPYVGGIIQGIGSAAGA